MITYFDRVKYLYPELQGYSYWHAAADGSSWENPYDGLVWDNLETAKPSQEVLDALDETTVENALADRAEIARKELRDTAASTNITVLAAYDTYTQINTEATLSEYLDYLETLIV